MAKRTRSVGSVKQELIRKSEEAALTAVQVFNNPLIRFKSETFIVLMIIAWTYLLHAYYRQNSLEYRYFTLVNNRRRFTRISSGEFKYWELSRCLSSVECPVDQVTKKNLELLIDLRNKIEHQMCTGLDRYLGGRYQACLFNYCHYRRELFDSSPDLEEQLSFTLQLGQISRSQIAGMKQDSEIPAKLQAFIAEFDDGLSEDAFNDERYSYRLIFTRKFANSKGQADVAIEFIDPKSATGEAINKEYWVQKEVEKAQYLPSQIVALMQEEGITRFKVHHHTQLWQDEDAKNPSKGYGTQLVNTWYWYESWISKVRDHCLDKPEQYS